MSTQDVSTGNTGKSMDEPSKSAMAIDGGWDVTEVVIRLTRRNPSAVAGEPDRVSLKLTNLERVGAVAWSEQAMSGDIKRGRDATVPEGLTGPFPDPLPPGLDPVSAEGVCYFDDDTGTWVCPHA